MNKIDPNAEIACELLYKDLMGKIDEIKNLTRIHVINLAINVLKAALEIDEDKIMDFMKELAPTLDRWAEKTEK